LVLVELSIIIKLVNNVGTCTVNQLTLQLIIIVPNRFAVDLLQHVRTTTELDTILNYDPKEENAELSKQLARLEQAIQYKQKRFVSHSHVQQLLAAIW